MLIAKTITIWTDVDGVFSADPRKVKEAVCLESLSYNEAWELSYFGANVLHPRTTLPAMRYHIPVVLRNYFNQAAPGTSICDQCEVETGGVMNPIDVNSDRVNFIKGLATIEDITIINVEGTGMVGVPGTANAVFQTVKEAGCNVVMISQASSEHSICFAVRSHEAAAAVKALNKRFEKAIAAGRIKAVEAVDECAILAAVGQNMCQTPGVSAMLFEALANANVNVVAIAQGASEYNITCVVSKKDIAKASPRRARQVLPLQDGHVRRHRRSRPRGQDFAQADEGTAGGAQDGLQRRPPRRRRGGAVQDAPHRRVRGGARPRHVGRFLRQGPGGGHGGVHPVRNRLGRAQRRHHRLQRL